MDRTTMEGELKRARLALRQALNNKAYVAQSSKRNIANLREQIKDLQGINTKVHKLNDTVISDLIEVANCAKEFVADEMDELGYRKLEDIEEPLLRKLAEKIVELDELWKEVSEQG